MSACVSRVLGDSLTVDAVLVAELLELRLVPSIDDLVGQAVISGLGACLGAGSLLLHAQIGKTRVAANRSDELVTSRRLGSGNAMGIKPLLEVGLGPRLIQPVARVGSSLTGLLSDGLIRAASLLEEGITLTGLGNYKTLASNVPHAQLECTIHTRNTVMITESLELAIGPSIEDPILDARPRRLALVLSLVPNVLHLLDQRVLAGGGRILGLNALELQVLLKLGGVPAAVGGDDIGIPVLLDELLQLLAVGGRGIRHVVVRKPSLQLGLMPLVVCCETGLSVSWCVQLREWIEAETYRHWRTRNCQGQCWPQGPGR